MHKINLLNNALYKLYCNSFKLKANRLEFDRTCAQTMYSCGSRENNYLCKEDYIDIGESGANAKILY